jgi:hypothetical protein
MSSKLMGALMADEKDWSRFAKDADELAAVTADDITKALGSCQEHALIIVTGPEGFVDHVLEKDGIEFEMFEWKDQADKLLETYDPKSYEKKMKNKEKSEQKSTKKMADLREDTAEWAGETAPGGLGEEAITWYQGEYTPSDKLTAAIYFRYNSTSSREHTPEVLEALEAYDGELDVVFLHPVKGTAIEQKVERFAQDYGIEYPIAGYGDRADLNEGTDDENETEEKTKPVKPMDARQIRAVIGGMKVAEEYDTLEPENYAAMPLVVLLKDGKYIGIYNPKALTKEFLDAKQ